MNGTEWRTTSRRLVLACAVAGYAQFAQAQTGAPVADAATSSAKNASELIGKLDQLVEQNRQLEKQNKELIEHQYVAEISLEAICLGSRDGF